MSRNRYDRDDDRDYSGQRGGRPRGEERYGAERGGRDRTGGGYDRDVGADDFYGTRGGGGNLAGGARYYERGDYGRGRYGERADYLQDERRYAGRERYRRDDDRDDGRAIYEEARDYSRGRSEERTERGASRSHVRCRDIMTRDVTVATRDTTLQEVAAMMRDEDTGVIPVVDREDAPALAGDTNLNDAPRINNRVRSNGRLVGLITDRDIVIRALAEGKDARTTRVEEVMTTDVHTAHPNDRVIEVIRKMGDKQVRRIPVVDDQENLRGIISMADVALETEEDRELADALEEISSGSSFWSKIFG
jgi:CBS domain-containing protein